MYFIDLINEALARVGKDRSDDAIVSRIKTLVSSKYQFVAHCHKWKELEKYQEIEIIPYTEGTISITKGSYTISGSFGAEMEGRYLELENGSALYRIRYVDNGSLVLFSPIAEDTDSSVKYKIHKIEYELNPNCRVILSLGHEGAYNKNFVQDSQLGYGGLQPNPYSDGGYNNFRREYSTGIASIAKDSNILTISGASLLGNVFDGAEIEIDSTFFYVKRVQSNTRAELLNYAPSAKNGSYTARNKDSQVIHARFSAGGSKSIICPVRFTSRVYPLLHEEKDQTELSDNFLDVIMAFVKAEFLSNHNDPKSYGSLLLEEAKIYLETMKKNQRLVSNQSPVFAPNIPTLSGRGRYGR